MVTACLCPVCQGSGVYKPDPLSEASSGPCHGCQGKGWVTVSDGIPIPMPAPVSPLSPFPYPGDAPFDPWANNPPISWQMITADGADLDDGETVDVAYYNRKKAKEIVAHVQAGRKFEAIKEYRSWKGVGLKDAKDEIDKIFYNQISQRVIEEALNPRKPTG